jgi:hypothetical protein
LHLSSSHHLILYNFNHSSRVICDLIMIAFFSKMLKYFCEVSNYMSTVLFCELITCYLIQVASLYQ